MTSVEEKEENLAAKDSEGLNQTDNSSAEVPQLLENSQLEINDMATFSEENRRGFPTFDAMSVAPTTEPTQADVGAEYTAIRNAV